MYSKLGISSEVVELVNRCEEECREDRKAILDILQSYEKVTDRQYKENKRIKMGDG